MAKKKEVEVEVVEEEKTPVITTLDVNFGMADMNSVVAKLNEIIAHLNK